MNLGLELFIGGSWIAVDDWMDAWVRLNSAYGAGADRYERVLSWAIRGPSVSWATRDLSGGLFDACAENARIMCDWINFTCGDDLPEAGITALEPEDF